jgi:hypothetical protein
MSVFVSSKPFFFSFFSSWFYGSRKPKHNAADCRSSGANGANVGRAIFSRL